MMDADELDKQISLLRGEYPQIKHLGMNEDETAYAFEFDSARECTEYLQAHPQAAKQYHYVKYEICKPYTRSIAAAWELVEEMPTSAAVINEKTGNWYCGCKGSFDEQGDIYIYEAVGKTAPEAISKCWLAWHEGQGRG